MESALVDRDTADVSLTKLRFVRKALLGWYDANGRKDLPWRMKKASKFHKLVAEVLLQKTQASTVASFFDAFVVKYPAPDSIVSEDERHLADMLMPLGLYNRRAKSLKTLAATIVSLGRIPNRKKELEKLHGIGPYTANAFLISAFGKRVPIVDTNVSRFVERFFALKVKPDPRKDPKTWDFVGKVKLLSHAN